MNITTTHEELSRCLDYVISAVPSTRIDPILSHVLVRAEKDQITMIGTNHEVQMTASCKGKIKGKIERILPADKLRRVLMTFESDDVINMDFSQEEVELKIKRSTFKLMTQKTENFSLLGETSEIVELETMSCEDFLDAISKVYYASAEDSHRRNLNGMLIHRTEEGINFVGTDGHRMALKRMEKPCGETTSHIVPVKTVHTLVKHLDGSGDVKISVNDRVICFNDGKFELISNIIQEVYPDYQHVIPRNNEKVCVMERQSLKKALDRVTALASNDATATLAFEENKLGVSANNTDNDSLLETLDVNYDSEKITLALNAVYLIQFLNACKDQMIEVCMSEPSSSVLIRPVEQKDALNYIIMPVRT